MDMREAKFDYNNRIRFSKGEISLEKKKNNFVNSIE